MVNGINCGSRLTKRAHRSHFVDRCERPDGSIAPQNAPANRQGRHCDSNSLREPRVHYCGQTPFSLPVALNPIGKRQVLSSSLTPLIGQYCSSVGSIAPACSWVK
jgi:hypothetical protein